MGLFWLLVLWVLVQAELVELALAPVLPSHESPVA